MKKIALFILISLIVAACAKDKGNYSYQEINKLRVVDQYDHPIDGATYEVEQGQDFVLAPQVSGSQSTFDSDQVDFYWIKDGHVVSRDKAWDIRGSLNAPGQYDCKLVVLDRQTTLSYSQAFSLIIYAGISKGTFILTEGRAKESTLVMSSFAGSPAYTRYQSFGGVSLGGKPLQINVNYDVKEGGKYYRQLFFTTMEGRYPMFAVDLVNLKPTLVFPVEGSVMSGESLRPTYYLQDTIAGVDKEHFVGMVIINGKCHYVESGKISPDIYPTDTSNYDFGEKAALYDEGDKRYVLVGYDRRNTRIRIFFNSGTGTGIFTGNYDEYPLAQLTKEHVFVAARVVNQGVQDHWQFLFRKGEMVDLVRFNTYNRLGNPIGTPVVLSRAVPALVNAIGVVGHGGYWYFAKGRTIYRFAVDGLAMEPFLTLPQGQTGDITAWNFYSGPDGDIKNIGIATFEPSAAQKHQGSYYLYDLGDKKYIRQDQYVIDRAVDLKLCF